VKARFIDGSHPDRIYLPSKISDNKNLDAEEYRQSLMHLMPITRERLMNGDWSVQDKAIFQEKDLRYYRLSGVQFDLLTPDKLPFLSIPQSDCRFFITVDPAGTSEEEDEISSSRSFSVIQVWAQPKLPERSRYLLLREQIRKQLSLAKLGKLIATTHRKWTQNERVWIENEKLGHGLIADLRKELPEHVVQAVPTRGHSKEQRAVPLTNKMERGEVFLPENDFNWRPDFERELLAWTGKKRERSDQIDAAAYAAIIAEQQAPGVLVMQHIAH
jgi:predicted phage terminase large subunit-like protein